jgi:nitrogen-specific signal transduction histidine kinase
MRRPGFLAFSIEAQIDAEGRLLSADPHLARLHLANGGVEGGKLAVPGLFNLVQLCWRTGSTLERPVRAADGERDLLLWAKASRKDAVVLLSISGWQEQNVSSTVPSLARDAIAGQAGETQRADMVLDHKGFVLQAAPWLIRQFGISMIARELAHSFVRVDEDAKPIWEANGKTVRIRSCRAADVYDVTVAPALRADGTIAGYGITFSDIPDRDTSTPAETVPKPVGFGKHFASAVRQPLSRIIANAETIRSASDGRLQENYLAYAQDISAAATHLNELISDLEDLDAIDREDFRVASELVELGDIARRVAGLLALKAADHHIHLMLPDPTIRVETIGEFRRVLQIVLNLVGNAIRYAPGGSSVHIRLCSEPPSISVCDEGKGVPVDDRERIFVKFERLGRSGDGGSGLGLYISRRLARAMKGDIEVAEAPEGGAMFTLRLPAYSTN